MSGGDPELIAALDSHLDRLYGTGERWVLDEIVSPTIHLDIHVIPPSKDFDFARLVTSGMAERPMTVPDGFDMSPFAELTMALPATWPLKYEMFKDERVYWPIRLLKLLGRLPHDYSTYLWYGHTIPHGNPPTPFADGTKLCCALVVPPLMVPNGFSKFQVSGGREVNILGVIPIYEDEMRMKLEKGTDALYDMFAKAPAMSDVVDPKRPSSIPSKRRLFGR